MNMAQNSSWNTTSLYSTWNSTSPHSSTVYVPGIVIYSLLSLISLLGNGLVIYACREKSRKDNVSIRFIMALSVADFMTGVGVAISIPFWSARMAVGKFQCLIQQEIFFTMALASQLLLSCTTLDRYLSICRNEIYKSWATRRFSTSQICGSFLFAFIISTLPFFGLNKWNKYVACSYTEMYTAPVYLIKGASMIIPMVFSIALYVPILMKAFQMHKRTFPMQDGHQGRKNEFILAKLMGIMTILFACNWLPSVVVLFLLAVSDQTVSLDRIGLYALLCGFLNSIVNPYIYAYQRRDFRKTWRRLFCGNVSTGGNNTN